MPRKVNSPKKRKKIGKGRRISAYIPAKLLATWDDIDNKSNFIQIALEDAVGIMTWAIMRENNPEKFHKNDKPIETVLPEFNKKFPLDPLTANRLGKESWPKTSQSEQELW